MSDEAQDDQPKQDLHIIDDIINGSDSLPNDLSFSIAGTDTSMSDPTALMDIPPDIQNLLGSTGDDPWSKPDGPNLTSSTSYQSSLSFTVPQPPPPLTLQQLTQQQHHPSQPMPQLMPQGSTDFLANIMARLPAESQARLKDIAPDQFRLHADKLLSSVPFPAVSQPFPQNINFNQLQQQALQLQQQHQHQQQQQHQPIQHLQQRPIAAQQQSAFNAPMIAGRAIAMPSTTRSTTTTSATSSSAPSGPSGDKIDYDTITDVMGYAGVDLREEAEFFASHGDSSTGILLDGEDRSRFQDFMHPGMLKDMVLKLAKPLAVSKIDPDFLSYLALATQDRLRTLIEQMIEASKYRTRAHQFRAPPLDNNGQPMYKIVVQQDVRKQLLALEHVDRTREWKRRRGMDMDESPQNDADTPSALRAKEAEALRAKGHHNGWVLSGKSSTRDGSRAATQKVAAGGRDMFLPLVEPNEARQVTVRDAIFALERDTQIGQGNGQRTLLKMYNYWLH